MAKKNPGKKNLKSLFSRSEPKLDEAVEDKAAHEDKKVGEKKKFKFPSLKRKSKGDGASETQQVLSAAKPAEDGEDWADGVAADAKKSTLYATAPRSKGKEFSYSELDLRKPKRFATFNFGLRKKKKKSDENISKSTFGLHSSGIEEPEPTVDLSQMEVDQTDVRKMISMSQPELDTNETFDIPSPPPVAVNQSESAFPLPTQSQSSVVVNVQPEPKAPLTNGSDFSDAQEEIKKAPIATIPELQLGDEKENAPVDESVTERRLNSFDELSIDSASAVAAEAAPCLPASIKETSISDYKVADPESVCAKSAILEHSNTKENSSLAESTRVTLSHKEPDAPVMGNNATANAEAPLTNVDAETAAVITTPLSHDDNSAVNSDSAAGHREDSTAHTERSVSNTAESISSTSSALSSRKSSPPVNQATVYGALYDSLFPQSFTSEVMLSLSIPPPKTYTETRHLDIKSAPVVVKTLNECHTEASTVYSPASASSSLRVYDALSGYTNTHSDSKVISSTLSSSADDETSSGPHYHHRGTSYSSTASELQTEPDALYRYKPYDGIPASEPVRQGDNGLHSQMTRFHSGGKLGSFVRDTVRTVNATPPVSDYVRSHGTDAQVTDSKRKVILVKELVTEETSADSGCPSPVSDKMAAVSSLEMKTETSEMFFTSAGQMDRYDGVTSPAYLSVGSDEGSAMETFFSAEEDNDEEKDVVYTAVERRESSVVDGMTEESRQREQMIETSTRDGEDGRRLVVVRMERYEDKTDSDEMLWESRAETHRQLRSRRADAQVVESGMFKYRVGAEGMSQEKEVTALPMKEDGEDERQEEFPAPPVQQVNALKECKVGPPSSEQHGQGEGSAGRWPAGLETENHQNRQKQFYGNWEKNLSQKGIRISESTHLRFSKYVTTPRLGEEELVSLSDEANRRGDESSGASPNATKTTVTETSGGVQVVTDYLTQSTELQSDATGTEHNRALQRSEGVDTITPRAEGNRAVQEQVAVELSAQDADAHHPLTETGDALVEGDQHPPEGQPDLNEGFRATVETPTTTSPEDLPSRAAAEISDNMYKVYSSLSTTLSTKSTSLQEDESKPRFHKVSLVAGADQPEAGGYTVDLSGASAAVMESNGTSTDSAYKWKNRFDGVYRFQSEPESSLSVSYSSSDTDSTITPASSSSALPEATAHKSLSTTLSPSPPPEEHIILSDQLSDTREVYLSRESGPAGAAEPEDERRRRGFMEEEVAEVEPSAPAGERDRRSEAEGIKSHGSAEELTESGYSSSHQASPDDSSSSKGDDASPPFTGVFKATLVELVSDPAAPPPSPPASPEAESPIQCDMDTLVDTLKNMGPSMRLRTMGLRGPAPVLVTSLPPIVEDAPNFYAANMADPSMMMRATGAPFESVDGLYTLPPDLGLKRSVTRDTRPPLELMKHTQQGQPGTQGFQDFNVPVLNGNDHPPGVGSRLDNSIIFSSFRSASVDQMVENGKSHRSLIRAASLPETGPSNDRMSVGPKEFSGLGFGADPAGSRFDRFSFLLNSSPSSTGSLTGAEDLNCRMSRPLSLTLGSPPSNNSPTHLLSPTSSFEPHRLFTNTTTDTPMELFSPTHGMAMGPPILQRSFSHDGSVGLQHSPVINMHGGSQFQNQNQNQDQDPEKNLLCKYRAFPDAYLTKEKEHGKLNPRPGKMYIFDRPGMCGQRTEIRSDVMDATTWELEETISIRVVRGGWVLYEKPDFKGEKIALDEGEIEITYPFNRPEEELQNGPKGSLEQKGDASDEQTEGKKTRGFVIGSIRRAVRDYSVPEISLFPEENAEGKKVVFRDTSDDARIFGFPIKANSIIINAGLWLVYAQPFFQGVPRVLEVGGYTNPAAWGVEKPYVGSLHPLKVGEPRVENLNEPKMVVYDKPYFTGKSRTITTHMKDFMTRMEAQQTAFMCNVGSLKVLGGIWVGYEKEGFRGHQYLLEEGEYQDWRVWGGCDAELRSVRVIRADFTDPLMVMLEQPEEAGEDMQEENTFEVTEAIPDVELYGYKTSTRSIHVLSGAWIAYSHVDFSGNQFILEKGLYNSCADWGSEDNRVCSVQPILMTPRENTGSKNEIILYREPNFQGECQVFSRSRETLPDKLLVKSCRVRGGSWVLYESKEFCGNMYVLSEGEYPNLSSMGCSISCNIRSIKAVPMMFAVPSISLFGLECLEGREITTDTEIINMMEDGFNNHTLSVRVNSGCWVLCEHSNYRGRQFLLEPIEITNWPKFSSLQTIGSMYPVKQKRCFFRIKNTATGHFMSVQGGVEELKSGRVVVTREVEPMSDIWFYQDGLVKNKMASNMSLQVMGNVEPGAKVVLWSETRQPVQTWTTQITGLITHLTFPGVVLDVKGGKTYDRDHVVIMPENEERPSQQWEIVLL